MASKMGKGLLCHLCGRQFGTASLEIHQKSCRARFEREHGRPAPEAPATGGNDAAALAFETEVLEPCPHCGRTFLPDRLQVHLRSCGSSLHRRSGEQLFEPSLPRRRSASPPPDAESQRRSQKQLPVCHLCGRQFGTASLEIHQKMCRAKFEREKGRPAPDAPAGGNDAAALAFETEVLEPCPHCGRTFLPDRLEVHLRSCKGAPTSRGELEQCLTCGRQFTQAQLIGHRKLCRPSGVASPDTRASGQAFDAAANEEENVVEASSVARGVSSADRRGNATSARAAVGNATTARAAVGDGRVRPVQAQSASARHLASSRSPSRHESPSRREYAAPSSARRPGPPRDAWTDDKEVSSAAPPLRVASRSSLSSANGRGGKPKRPAAERLFELKGLLDQGLISDAEYAAKRASVLADL